MSVSSRFDVRNVSPCVSLMSTLVLTPLSEKSSAFADGAARIMPNSTDEMTPAFIAPRLAQRIDGPAFNSNPFENRKLRFVS